MAADAVLPGREAAARPGHGRAGCFTYRAARALLTTSRAVCTDEGRRQLVGVGGKVDIDGCCGYDTSTRVRHSDVCMYNRLHNLENKCHPKYLSIIDSGQLIYQPDRLAFQY